MKMKKKIYEIIEKYKTIHHDTLLLKFDGNNKLDSIILQMELKGIIERLPGNYLSLL